MKKIFVPLFVLFSLNCFSQISTPPNYIKLNSRYYFNEIVAKTLHFPSGGTTPTLYSGWTGAGAPYWDSVGKKLRVWDGTYFRMYTDSVYKLTDSSIVIQYGTRKDTLVIKGTGGGAISMGTYGSSPNANGASISGGVLTLQPADLTHPGGVSTTTQTFGGDKTFNSTNGIAVTNKIKLENASLQELLTIHSDSISNIFIGDSCGTSNNLAGGGTDNIGIGWKCLFSNTTGFGNTAVGKRSLITNATGQNNCAFGADALTNTTGSYNIGIGTHSLQANTSGARNIAIGTSALANKTTTGTENVAIGDLAASSGAAAFTDITAIGHQALLNVTGNFNTALGAYALNTLTSGTNNTGLGEGAGFSNSTGSGNVFIGFQAGYNETGSNKLYIANTNTSTPLIAGDFSATTINANGQLRLQASTTGLSSLRIASGTAPTSPSEGDTWNDATAHFIRHSLNSTTYAVADRSNHVSTTASSSTPTPNADTDDEYTVTALATNPTFGAPTGTPLDGQALLIRIKDNGTSRTLSWNAAYRASTDLPLPTATTISKTMYLQFLYNSTDSKWDLIGLLNNFDLFWNWIISIFLCLVFGIAARLIKLFKFK